MADLFISSHGHQHVENHCKPLLAAVVFTGENECFVVPKKALAIGIL